MTANEWPYEACQRAACLDLEVSEAAWTIRAASCSLPGQICSGDGECKVPGRDQRATLPVPGVSAPPRPRPALAFTKGFATAVRRERSAPIAMLLGLLTVSLAASLGVADALLPWLWAVPFALGLTTIDVRCRRLPHSWLVPLAIGGTALFLFAAWHGGTWPSLGRAVASSIVVFVTVAVLQLASLIELGFGDTKLYGVVGLYCGWVGWTTVLAALVISCILNGLIGVYLLLAPQWNKGCRFAAGPGILAGAVIAVMLP